MALRESLSGLFSDPKGRPSSKKQTKNDVNSRGATGPRYTGIAMAAVIARIVAMTISAAILSWRFWAANLAL
jgi:hypothetical protein